MGSPDKKQRSEPEQENEIPDGLRKAVKAKGDDLVYRLYEEVLREKAQRTLRVKKSKTKKKTG